MCEESSALQLTVVCPNGKVEPEAGVHATASGPSTASVALAAKVATAPFGPSAVTVIGPGTVITGGVVSCTVTVNVSVRLWCWESWAVQLTVVLPSANVEPEAGVHATGTGPSTRSAAVAL